MSVHIDLLINIFDPVYRPVLSYGFGVESMSLHQMLFGHLHRENSFIAIKPSLNDEHKAILNFPFCQNDKFDASLLVCPDKLIKALTIYSTDLRYIRAQMIRYLELIKKGASVEGMIGTLLHEGEVDVNSTESLWSVSQRFDNLIVSINSSLSLINRLIDISRYAKVVDHRLLIVWKEE